MAVVPMQKVRLLTHQSTVDEVLSTVQRFGAVEFREVDVDEVSAPNLEFPNASLWARTQHAVHFLSEYAPTVGLIKGLREGTLTKLTEESVANYLKDTDALESIVTDLEAVQVEFAEKNEMVKNLEEERTLLVDWKSLPVKLSDLETTKTVTFLLKHAQATEENSLEKLLTEYVAEQNIPSFISAVNCRQVAVTLEKSNNVLLTARQITDSVGAEIITLSQKSETVDVVLVAVEEALAKAKGEVALLIDQAEHFAISHLRTLRQASEILSWQHARFQVVSSASSTRFSVVFDGWLRADVRPQIEAIFAEKKIPAVFTELEINDGEEPPVEIKNSNFMRPFEIVTRLYGMPGYHDLDPTTFLAGFFFLYFGFSLTDVGYGFALLLASAVTLLFFKVGKGARLFAKLLLYISIATILVGILFGGYFGFSPELLPEVLQKLQLFDPIGNPLPVFYFALSLGVIQVMVGMMLRIYSEAKQGRLMTGLMDQGPWLLMFILGVMSLLTSLGYISLLAPQQLTNLMYVTVVLIVLGSGRNGKGLVGKIISALAGLYEGIGYFSDILSYSRLLALGLATSALAFAVNLIAAMLVDVPYVGLILAGAILFVGHLFTLAINTLGAFVHSARLQFVEFFGKFISGTGKEFSPLTRTENYVTIDDD